MLGRKKYVKYKSLKEFIEKICRNQDKKYETQLTRTNLAKELKILNGRSYMSVLKCIYLRKYIVIIIAINILQMFRVCPIWINFCMTNLINAIWFWINLLLIWNHYSIYDYLCCVMDLDLLHVIYNKKITEYSTVKNWQKVQQYMSHWHHLVTLRTFPKFYTDTEHYKCL